MEKPDSSNPQLEQFTSFLLPLGTGHPSRDRTRAWRPSVRDQPSQLVENPVPEAASHLFEGLERLQPLDTHRCTALGHEAVTQAEAGGRDQQDPQVGSHQAHRVGDVV